MDPLSTLPTPIAPQEWPKQKAWSISAVRNHDTCPLKFRFQRIDRLPEPQDGSGPLARGTAIHEMLAHAIQHGYWPDEEIPETLKLWDDYIDSLRVQNGMPEKQIAFRKDWTQCEWYAQDVWARFVFDVVVEPTPDNDWTVKVVDWKSGKKYDTHSMDARLYALAALKMYPDAKRASVSFHYVDRPPTGDSVGYACERGVMPDLEAYSETFNHDFLNDTLYPARTGFHCRWCHFRKSNNGPCAFG
jgi:hypothetical protein